MFDKEERRGTETYKNLNILRTKKVFSVKWWKAFFYNILVLSFGKVYRGHKI